MARHNPFPHQPLRTKLEALDQVSRYVASAVKDLEGNDVPGSRRIA